MTGAPLNWTLHDYSIGGLIASGHFGTVYLARHVPSGREVALKLIPLHGPDSDEKVAAERHGAVLQQRFGAAHPRLVPDVFEHLPIAPFYAIAMELVQGRQLTTLIADGPVPARQAAEIALAIARFLEKAHQFETDIEGQRYALILHADLKPDHILLLSSGEIRVLDFGIAKALSTRTLVTTNKWGSVQYASPERLQSDGQVNEHADFWALGVMLFEMLAGYRPYRRYEHNASLLDKAIRKQEARDPLPPHTEPALAAIVQKLLAPQPERRYQRAAIITQDLEAFLAGRPTTAGLEYAQASQETVRLDTRRQAPAVAALPRSTTTVPTEPLPRHSTAPSPAPPHVPPQATPPAPPPTTPRAPGPLTQHPRGMVATLARMNAAQWSRLGRTIAVLFIVFITVGEGMSLIRGQRLLVRVPALEAGDISRVRQEYDRIGSGTLVGLGQFRVARALSDRLAEMADRTIVSFREELPSQAQWEQARDQLDFAVTLEPGDMRLASRRAYVRGQLARIESMRLRDDAARSRKHTEAIRLFHDAARLDPRSFDPYLGLASVHAYGTHDLEALTTAVEQAQRLGYKTGDRERAEFGDVHRTLADEARAAALGQSGPARIAALEKAVAGYTKCIEHFDGLNLGQSEQNLRHCQRRLTEMQALLPPVPPVPALTGNEL